MNKTVRTWFVVLAALAIVAAACGEDDTTSGATGGAIEPSMRPAIAEVPGADTECLPRSPSCSRKPPAMVAMSGE